MSSPFWIFSLWVLVFSGCKPSLLQIRKENGASTDGRKQFSDLYATGTSEIRGKSNFYFGIFNKNYELAFDKLPANGSVDDAKIPYVGSWYPQKSGGTSRDSGTGNVLQKYDKVFNAGVNKAQQWEKDHHTVDASSSAAGWAGHCNGFSASAQRHEEPKKSVTRGETTFSQKDIKALLAEIHMSAKFYFLGGNRCKQDSKILLGTPIGRADPMNLGDCEDVNPATFHTAMANWIGIQKHTVIADIFSRDQVWNYPHYKYESTSKAVDIANAMQLITGQASSTYKFNSAAVGFRSVTMKTYLSRAYEGEYLTSEVAIADRVESKTYQYVLELDAAGRIIGGEWVGSSQQDHPDFVWVALEPSVSDGSEFSANPNLDPKEVIKLWAESINADPNAPPLDILEPKTGYSWGRFPKFEISINGLQSGSIFLGRPQQAVIKRLSALHGEIALELKVDGVAMPSKSTSGDANIEFTLPDMSPGVHVVEFSWLKGSELADNQVVKLFAQ